MEQNLSVINDLLPVLTSGNTGVWVCDTSSGQIEFKNDFFDILGLSDVRFSSLDELRAVIHSDDLPAFEQAFVEASTGKSTTVSYRYCLEDKQMQIESKLMPCGNGVVACTRNKDAALQLQRLAKQFRMVVNSMFPNFTWVFSDTFHIKDIILPDGVKLFHSREQLIGMDARNQYAPEVNELLVANIHESLKNNQWKEVEYYIDLFGTRYFYQSRIVPLDKNTVFCLNLEIGDRVRRMNELLAQRQRAEESDRMKSVFIANISHEIRTPLNAIVGFSEFIMNEKNPEKQQKYMDIIRSNNAILLQIIDDILELSRIEAGISEFHFEETDITALIMEVEKQYTPDMKPDVRLLTDIPETNIQVFTDANHLKQVLDNLMSNAIKHTEKGYIILKMEKSEDYLVFSVCDTGCGIPSDKAEVIFNHFEKLNSFVQGTGLGLSICKAIADRLGGKITVTSTVGEGSIFSFTIPYRHVAPSKKNIGSMRELIDNQRKIIQVFETSESDMQYIREILTKNYDVVEITDIEKIIASFILDQPNLIMVNMQVAGRKDIIDKLRAIKPNIPIIAMTSSDYYHDQRMAFENGCTDMVAKPLSPTKVEEMVMAFIA